MRKEGEVRRSAPLIMTHHDAKSLGALARNAKIFLRFSAPRERKLE